MPDTNLNFTETTNPALTVKIVGFSSTAPGAELTMTLNTLLNVIRGNVKIDDLVQGDDNTDLNASTSRHGLLPKLGANGKILQVVGGVASWVDAPEGTGGGTGADGNDGWSPIFAVVTDSARRVLQIVDWTGGEGTKPSTTNQFIGASGIVSTAAAAVDIRGATGASGSGSGDMSKSVYDSNDDGKVNAAVAADSVPYTGVTGKPSTFPPSTHSHTIADTTGLQAALDGKQASGSYAAASHTHAIADTTGLQAALDGKQAAGSYAASSHTHTASQISDAGALGLLLIAATTSAAGRGSLGVLQTQETPTAISAAGNTDITRASNSNQHTAFLSVGAGSGTYTRTLTLLTTNSPVAGNRIKLVMSMAASANPTLSVRNATSGGTEVAIIKNPAAIADVFVLDFEYTGSAWTVLTSAGVRTKDLPNSTTSAAGDDYVELDGATNGPRKILASNLSGGASYTDEQAQDAIGGALTDTDTVDLAYNDGAGQITANVRKQMSIDSDSSGVKLSGDSATPGNTKYYGTNGSGVKGWYDLTTGGSGAAVSQTKEFLSGYIAAPTNKDYKIAVKMPHAGTITELTTITESGTCTLTGKVNTTALGGTANAASSSEQSQAHASSNTFAAGDDIVLTVSSASSPVGLSFLIKYTRNLDA